MEKKPEQRSSETERRIAIRWMVMQALGGTLIALGIFVDWPPPLEAGLPDTSSFLIILGGLLGVAGVLASLRHG